MGTQGIAEGLVLAPVRTAGFVPSQQRGFEDWSVAGDKLLYDILNEFQEGHSHMAVVIRQTNPNYPAEQPVNDGGTLAWNKEVSIAIDDKCSEKVMKKLPPLRRWKSYPNSQNSNRGSRSRKWSKDQSDVLQIHEEPLPTLCEDEEAIGIITMQDVIEELLQFSDLQTVQFVELVDLTISPSITHAQCIFF